MAKTFPGTILLPTTKINILLEDFIVSEKFLVFSQGSRYQLQVKCVKLCLYLMK